MYNICSIKCPRKARKGLKDAQSRGIKSSLVDDVELQEHVLESLVK